MKIDKIEKYDLDINGYKISLSKTELQELHTMIGNTLGLNSININTPYEEWKYPYPTTSPIIGDSTDMTTTYPNRPWNNPFSYGAGPVDTITLTSNMNDYKITLGD